MYSFQVIIDGTQIKWLNNGFKSKLLTYKLNLFNGEQTGDVTVAALNDTDCFFQLVDKSRQFNQNEIVVFQCRVSCVEHLAIRISLFENECLASCALVLKGSHSHINVPLVDENSGIIGTINLWYVVIKPLDFELHKDNTTFKSRIINGIHIGHKGAGNNRRHDTKESVIENTIASLNYAVNHGADMVEFDVLLTKDNIPIVYHDFYVDVSVAKLSTKSEEWYSLRIKDLTFEQLQTLKLRPVPVNGFTKFEVCESDNCDNKPFVSLQKVLTSVKPVAFNLEIKYPSFEDNDMDMNEYVDEILNTVVKFGGDREIIISCFDPNVCAMLRLKQNKYLILYLTHGNPKRYEGSKIFDRRMWSVELATHYAQCMKLAGVNCNVRCLLDNMSLIDFVTSRKLLLFCFGDDINHSDFICQLQKAGVHGIIYDKIDKLMPKLVSISDGNQ